MDPNNNTKKLNIRPTTDSDTPLIVELICELAEYEKLGDEVTATVESIRDSLFGANPSAECVIAESGGAPVGFALFFHNFSTFVGKKGLYLEDLYIRDEFRGEGFGKMILAYLAKLALERDCGRFEWAVLDWNKPAIGFYEKLGAKGLDDWTIFRLSGSALDRLAKTVE